MEQLPYVLVDEHVLLARPPRFDQPLTGVEHVQSFLDRRLNTTFKDVEISSCLWRTHLRAAR